MAQLVTRTAASWPSNVVPLRLLQPTPSFRATSRSISSTNHILPGNIGGAVGDMPECRSLVIADLAEHCRCRSNANHSSREQVDWQSQLPLPKSPVFPGHNEETGATKEIGRRCWPTDFRPQRSCLRRSTASLTTGQLCVPRY